MLWRTRVGLFRAYDGAKKKIFQLLLIFFLFGMLVLIKLLLLQRPNVFNTASIKSRGGTQTWINPSSLSSGEENNVTSSLFGKIPLDGVWQPVAGTRYKFFVYSAFVERRTAAAVRVIAATKTKGADPVMCRITLKDRRTFTLTARTTAIRENWDLKYSAAYVLCLLGSSGVKPHETVGASLAVVAKSAPNRPSTNMLLILDTEPKTGIEGTVHVCVKALHSSYSYDDWLLEWFEMNKLLGVSHFYMYNHSLSDSVSCLLSYYHKQGLITLRPWILPYFVSQVTIRMDGLFAAFNDCLYRSMRNAEWLLELDVDELIIPRDERTLPALLTTLGSSYKPPSKAPAAFLFRNAFFYMLWEDDASAPAQLVTARKTRRWSKPHEANIRSKFAVRPRDAVELGNHFVWELLPGAASAPVSIDVALLHHYRESCEANNIECVKVQSTVDRTAQRWTDQLLQKIASERTKLTAECPTFKKIKM